MHTTTLAPDTKKVLVKLSKLPLPYNFYLSGGTALALHLGHRESVDLDFFSQTDFDVIHLQSILTKELKLSGVVIDKGTLNCYADGVKLQFLYYPYKLLVNPEHLWNVPISSVQDIAATKLLTISSRGSKKDFVDIYFILKTYPLDVLFGFLKEKYTNLDYNILHILKSLVYFDDAEHQPIPKMHLAVEWAEVKQAITKIVGSFRI